MSPLEFGGVGLSGLLASLICSIAVVKTTRWHGEFSLDGTTGIQKHHVTPIPRIGGFAILIGLGVVHFMADASVRALLGPILLASLPAFCFGLLEDLTKRVSVRARLLATMASGVVAWLLTGITITHTELWGVDTALTWLPFSVFFTAFAVGGVANAVNIIDGFNGLASGTVAICMFTLGLVGYNAGDHIYAVVCFAICCVVIGFMFVNFPFGKLFLGDGGAYMLGFILAWLAVALPARNPSISVWASFLACGYPIFETVFTIGRRLWVRSHPGLPDSGHLHSLVKVAVSNRLFPQLRPHYSNALVSPFCWALAALTALFAVRYSENTFALVFCTLISFGVYVAFYWYVSTSARLSASPVLDVAHGAVSEPGRHEDLETSSGADEIASAHVG